MAALKVADLRRAFGGIEAVAGVDMTVETQEVVGVIGPNGSGKSTLFNLLTGVMKPSGGQIVLFDRDITGQPPHRIARAGVGRTFQIPALFSNMTVRENLLAAAVESDWKGGPEHAAEVLDLLDLRGVALALAKELSGGQQRLLELGRVLMRDPQLVLLDEVAAGVHPQLRENILSIVKRLHDDGKTFIVIEHDMEFARSICERVFVMDAGEIVARGTFEEISRDQYVMEAYLGSVG